MSARRPGRGPGVGDGVESERRLRREASERRAARLALVRCARVELGACEFAVLVVTVDTLSF